MKEMWKNILPFYKKFPEEAIKGNVKVIHQDERIPWVFGKENIGFNEYLISTSQMTGGIFQISPYGKMDNSDAHDGDEFYYVLSGIGVLIVDGKNFYKISENEACYLPRGHEHQWINISENILRVLWIVSPDL